MLAVDKVRLAATKNKEVDLALFNRQRKSSDMSLAISLEPDAVAVAVVRNSTGERPALIFSRREVCADGAARPNVLASLLRQLKVKGLPCTAIIPLNSYQTLQLDLAGLSVDEGRKAARWQLGERLDYPAEEAIIDFYQIVPFGGEMRPQHYAVTARYQVLREYVDNLRQPGLKLSALDIPEFVLRNICELFVDDQRGVAVLLLFEQSGLLVVARDGVLYLARQLNVGMETLLSVTEEERESRFDAIVLDVQRSFDFCESTLRLPLVSRLLVAQTRQEIPQLISYLERMLATRVEPLRLDTVMDLPADADQLALNQQLLAIGGALRKEDR